MQLRNEPGNTKKGYHVASWISNIAQKAQIDFANFTPAFTDFINILSAVMNRSGIFCRKRRKPAMLLFAKERFVLLHIPLCRMLQAFPDF
jgi:hypothetical protein